MWWTLLSSALAASSCPEQVAPLLASARASGDKAAYAEACLCGSMDACAEWVVHPEHTDDDVKRAALAASMLCGSGADCSALASGDALVEVERLCLSGQAARCAEAAVRWRDGDGVAADRDKALGWFRAACVGGYWYACNDLTLMGDPLGEKVSLAKFIDECEGGSASSCYQAGARLRVGYMGAPKDDERGRALLQKSCDSGYGTGCYTLGWPLLFAERPDIDAYFQMMVKGCMGGSPDACSELKVSDAQLRQACRSGGKDNVYCALLERRKAGRWPDLGSLGIPD